MEYTSSNLIQAKRKRKHKPDPQSRRKERPQTKPLKYKLHPKAIKTKSPRHSNSWEKLPQPLFLALSETTSFAP